MRFAKRKSLLDIPNFRSSHQYATPRGGGLAIVISFNLIMVTLACIHVLPKTLVEALLIGGTLIAIGGFIDDIHTLSASKRFMAHIVAAVIAISFIGDYEFWGWLGYFITGAFIVWFTNVFNFMDGIDGLAGVEAITISISAIILLSLIGQTQLIYTYLFFAAAVSGFQILNWPPAKIFMGDVGSSFLGYTIAILVIYTAKQTYTPCWPWLILLGSFLVDATVTLLTRMLTGQAWLQAHCQHAYQHAAKYYGQHRIVTLSVAAINIVWLLPWAIAALHWPQDGFYFLICAYAPLVIICKVFAAGYNSRTKTFIFANN